MARVKICGITCLDDALMTVEAGADALGFVFFERSPRYISPDNAATIISQLPPFVQTVGLFVNEIATTVNSIADHCHLDIVQLHGEESPEYCASINRRIIKAFRVKDISTLLEMKKYDVAGYLLDAWSPTAHGGTGETFNWEIAASASSDNNRIILAGGLTAENISLAIQTVKPYAVDVSSGVERAPGKKDIQKMKSFIHNAKGATR